MKSPNSMGELRQFLATVMAGALNGDVKEKEGRLALTAATRIIEAYQAECRSRVIANTLKEKVVELGKQSLT